jgi:FkbM family methyltransferase
MSKKKKLHLSDSACLNIGKILIDSSLPNDICVFDVGANEGLFARRVVDQWPIKKIDLHCFEPNPAAYAILAEKLVDASTFTLVEIGLSSQEGTGTLYHPEKKTVLGSLAHREVFDSKVKQWGDVKAHSVKLSTLDAYRRVTKIIQVDYLKIDTEGFELDVLQGAAESLSQHRIVCGQLEYGGTFFDRGISVHDVVDFLSIHGYVLFDLVKRTEVNASYIDDFALNNLFFCQAGKKELVEKCFLQTSVLYDENEV